MLVFLRPRRVSSLSPYAEGGRARDAVEGVRRDAWASQKGEVKEEDAGEAGVDSPRMCGTSSRGSEWVVVTEWLDRRCVDRAGRTGVLVEGAVAEVGDANGSDMLYC